MLLAFARGNYACSPLFTAEGVCKAWPNVKADDHHGHWDVLFSAGVPRLGDTTAAALRSLLRRAKHWTPCLALEKRLGAATVTAVTAAAVRRDALALLY